MNFFRMTEKTSMGLRFLSILLSVFVLSSPVSAKRCDDLARGFREVPGNFFANPAKKGFESFLALAQGRLPEKELALLKNAIEVDRKHPGMALKEKLLLIRADHLAKDQLWKLGELKKVVDAPGSKEEVKKAAAALSVKIEEQARKGRLGYYELLEQTLDFCFLVTGTVRGPYDYQVVSASGRTALYPERGLLVSTRLFFPTRYAASTRQISRQLVFGVSLLGELGCGESIIADGTRFRNAVEFLGHDMDHRLLMASIEEELKDRARSAAGLQGTRAEKEELFARAVEKELATFEERVRFADALARLEAVASALPQDDRDLVENGFFYITHEYRAGLNGDPRSPATVSLLIRELQRLRDNARLRNSVIKDMKKAYMNPDHMGSFFKNPAAITPERIGKSLDLILQVLERTPAPL